tara:strand:- start:168 stop:395 length:228 start_codon:yes stop_codon:yes gene_type:complete
MNNDQKIIEMLALKVVNKLKTKRTEIERQCWLEIHEHLHGMQPSEYDIREIDEELFNLVLSESKKLIEKEENQIN